MWAPSTQLRGLAVCAQSCTLMCGCAGWALEQELKLVFCTDTAHGVQDECVNAASTAGHVCVTAGYQMP